MMWAKSLSTRFVLSLRSRVTPYQEMAEAMPARGRIIDLGCGSGLLSFALCAGSAHRVVIGIDHDPDRVTLARQAAGNLPVTCRPEFQLGDMTTFLDAVPDGSLAGVAMIDVLHYFDSVTQLSLIGHAARSLRRGGILLARDIDAEDGLRSVFNRLYERLATGVGFTKSTNARMLFRSRSEWTKLFERAGFVVRSEHSGVPFLADVLFTAVKL